MGSNAIVHHCELTRNAATEAATCTRGVERQSSDDSDRWDAAVKRQFSLPKMLAFIEHRNEAGVAKRLRMAGQLNQGRLLHFYGLGIALASNNEQHDLYKLEAVLLSQFQPDFSSYTLKRFMDDYMRPITRGAIEAAERDRLEAMHETLTLIKVKVLLVSLLNGFRDLTLMGVQAFDFNHLNNVLISRDYHKARLIDIDGGSRGSIDIDSRGAPSDIRPAAGPEDLHRPALDVDLATLLPLVLQQLMFGKGRGKSFVDETVSQVRRAKSGDEAKAIITRVLRTSFFADSAEQVPKVSLATRNAHRRATGLPEQSAEEMEEQNSRELADNKHLHRLVEWLYAVLLKRTPWEAWTNDIYDAMRCIDHLPIG